jgi:microcystin-dependent protein
MTHNTDTVGSTHTHSMAFEWGSDTAGGSTGIRVTDIQDKTGGGGTNATASLTGGTHTHGVGNTGSGAAHNNLQPYLTLNFIIKT